MARHRRSKTLLAARWVRLLSTICACKSDDLQFVSHNFPTRECDCHESARTSKRFCPATTRSTPRLSRICIASQATRRTRCECSRPLQTLTATGSVLQAARRAHRSRAQARRPAASMPRAHLHRAMLHSAQDRATIEHRHTANSIRCIAANSTFNYDRVGLRQTR